LLRVGSNFTGIGAWEKGLTNLEIDHEMKFFSEIDKYAIESYCVMHGVDDKLNIGDITQVQGNEVPDIDLFVYSPPCQSWSVAGKREGFDDRRGVLFFDSLRVIEQKRPPICLMENVKGMVSKRFKNEFESMLQSLNDLGYTNYWKVLNLKDYGLPQNRERLFIVSLRNDIDDGKFEFPEQYDSGLRLKDLLEDVVDEKYYCSNQLLTYIENKKSKAHNFRVEISDPEGIRETPLRVRGDLPIVKCEENDCVCVGRADGINGHDYLKRVYSPDGCSPTVTTVTGGNQEIKVVVGLVDDQGRKGKKLDIKDYCPTLRAQSHGNEPKIIEDFYANRDVRVYDDCPTIRADRQGLKVVEPKQRIRKLTPKECWRLQGFSDEDYEKAKAALNEKFYKGKDKSNSQMYKMAGNSIGIKKLEALYKSLEPYFEKVRQLNMTNKTEFSFCRYN
jgi:DNA (cytosine-5)-methyltransferase 1